MRLKTDITNNINKAVPNIKQKIPSNMFKAVMKCGGLVKIEAASRAPSRKIANAIKVIGRNIDGSPESNTGFSKSAKGWYGKFFESGAKKHDIKPKNGKVLTWLRVGGTAEFAGKKTAAKYYITKDGQHSLDADSSRNFITIVHHPGMKKNPFLVPSYQTKAQEIKQIIGDAVVTTSMESAREGGG